MFALAPSPPLTKGEAKNKKGEDHGLPLLAFFVTAQVAPVWF